MAIEGLIGKEKASVLKGRLGRRESANQALNLHARLVFARGQGEGQGRGGERRKFSEQMKTLGSTVRNPLLAQ